MNNNKKKLGLIVGISGMIFIAILVVAYLQWPAHQFMLDVNPSLEITTNRLERITSIKALNEDGREFLEGFEIKDRDLEVVINDLVDRMILTGHIIGGQDNVVMITVKNEDLTETYVEKVNQAIAAFLENKQLEYMILNQGRSDEGDNDDHLEISKGKLALIQKLIDRNENLTFDDLAEISLQDLLNIAEQMNLSLQDLFHGFTRMVQKDYVEQDIDSQDNETTNESNNVEVIGRDKAIEIALEKVGGGVVKEFEYDRDDREYEIEIYFDGYKYELEIDAYTGEIKEFERERDENYFSGKVIGRDKAIKIALEKVGGGVVKEFEYDRDDREYEIEIYFDGYEYELEIDAYTGEIKEFERERDENYFPSKVIGRDKAIKIGLEKVGGGVVKEFEYDRDDREYEIEIYFDGYEYELEIDAYTGEIKEFERQRDDDYSSSPTSRTTIGSDKAIAIALKRVGGGTVIEFKYDQDDGEYEIEIKYNGREYELEIDAYTGKILEFEID
ncbi:PepSY domain-containing protein [Alkalicella caledoniensis]|uniref:PepSY domain-containing protein n=1 Tax=Alkalicella caledoniensis TaxID=2731377 RepID=A0A7G9W3M7_ALKCA|nr:PepSY domain-containing protein [Alkalicella caledoniensis]QNO13289.1 PepSY domain-containing protein [Alkalicella caledoniensis]